MSQLSIVVAVFCGVLGLAGTAYFALSAWAGLKYRNEARQQPPIAFTPPVSILKSLKGIDPRMYAAFVSHCTLDYPEYEILFGASTPQEPALELVTKLQRDFPDHKLRIIHCPKSLGSNGKVSNLAQMLPHAEHEHVIINDSDIVVPPQYLRDIMSPFGDRAAGMVTTLYRGVAGSTIGSKLEALGISTDFAGGVLLARAMEGGIRFGLGATIATTKTVLEKIGGLEQLADFLGDDYELGARTAAAGFNVELAGPVLETTLSDYTLRDFWLHQMRWARNVKDRRPAQYFGLIATFGLPWAILGVIAAPLAWWAWSILAITVAARVTAAIVGGRLVLKDEHVMPNLWLIPLRDVLALAIWIASFWGDTVEWRGTRFRLRDGKLQPVND